MANESGQVEMTAGLSGFERGDLKVEAGQDFTTTGDIAAELERQGLARRKRGAKPSEEGLQTTMPDTRGEGKDVPGVRGAKAHEAPKKA